MTLKSGSEVTQGSLKVVPFESLGTVSYSPSIVTMSVSVAISEIFSVKQWPDLEICIWGRPRSLKMTKLIGGLSRLHSADEDAVSWLTNYGK